MAEKSKPPKKPKIWVLGVEKSNWDENEYMVTVTKHQVMKLPEWVREVGPRWIGAANPKHVYTHIQANDELQAMTRFYKFWGALMTIEE
jgi:hypothetical protein